MVPGSVQTPLDRPLRLATRLAFGVGQVAEGIKSFSFSLFLLFYYNSVLGLSGSLCGAAIAIALAVDALTDPLVGSISDRRRSRWGRRHPFMLAAAIPLGLSFYGLFSPPASLGPAGLFLWLTGFAVATRTAMTFYHVPHISLGAELSSNFVERTRVVAVRQVFGYLGAVVVAALGFGLFFADARGGRSAPEAYAPFGLAMGALMVVAIGLSTWGTWREIPYLPVASPDDPASGPGVLRRLLRDARAVLRNASFRHLFGGTLLIFVMVGTDSALALYMYEYFWALADREILALSLAYPVGLIGGAALTRRLHERWDKAPTLVFGTFGWSVCQLLPVVLRLADAMPANGTTALVTMLLGFRLLQGAVVQQALVSFNAMMADIADEHELASGRRQEGLFFGVVSFSGKAASGAGSFLAGAALDGIGWPAGLGQDPTVGVAAGTIRALGWVYGPLVAVFSLFALLAFRGYALDRTRHARILVELRERALGDRRDGAPGGEQGVMHPPTGESD